MSAFITLGNAARCMAGGDATPQEIATFATLLESEADSLRAVKTWIEHTGDLPGGVSFWHAPDQWRILKVAFFAWCKANGYPTNLDEEKSTLVVTADTDSTGAQGKRDKQIAKILEIVGGQGWEAMSIPVTGKRRIKALCLQDCSLFTDSGYDHAWKAARAQGRLRTEQHDISAKRY